jgi:hypothetical protein
MPPVSSLSWAENEVRFPVRFAKNRTSFSCLCAVQRPDIKRCCTFLSLLVRHQRARSLLVPPLWP